MKTTAFLLFILFSVNALSQEAGDFKKFDDLFAVESHKHDWGEQLKNNENELSFIFSFVFVVYKELISSQDIDACVFTPSCSVYAIETIKKNGVIIGYFDAVDRLTRCNPGRNKNLPVDPRTGRYSDPLE